MGFLTRGETPWLTVELFCELQLSSPHQCRQQEMAVLVCWVFGFSDGWGDASPIFIHVSGCSPQNTLFIDYVSEQNILVRGQNLLGDMNSSHLGDVWLHSEPPSLEALDSNSVRFWNWTWQHCFSVFIWSLLTWGEDWGKNIFNKQHRFVCIKSKVKILNWPLWHDLYVKIK